MMKIKPSLWALMLTTLTLLGCNNGDEGLTGSVPELPESVSELVVTPKNESLPVGLEWPFKAEAVLNNGEVKNVTTREEITWSSSDDSIASVDTNGIVTAKEGGAVTITASGRSDGTDFIDTAELTVTEAIVTSLVITPPKEPTVAIGLPIQYTATAYFSDDTSLNVTTNKNVTWASTSEDVATISNAPENKGEAKGITEGVTTITATGTLNGVTFDDSTTLTVTGATVTELTISAEDDSIPVGLTTQFTAIATLSNGQNIDVTDFDEITWTSEDASIATIDNETSPENETVKGRATGIKASSSPVHIFARGNVNGVDFEASEPLLVSGATVTKIVVSSENTSIPEGLTEQFKAEALFSDDRAPVDVTEHPDVTWTSSNTEVATVDNDGEKGLVTGVKSGVVTISAAGDINGSSLKGESPLSVEDNSLQSISIEPASVNIAIQEQEQLVAKGHYGDGRVIDITDEVSWSEADSNIATVVDGVVTGIAGGVTTTMATVNGLSSSLAVINVEDKLRELEVKETAVEFIGVEAAPVQLTAVGTFSSGKTEDVTNRVTWSVIDEDFVQVSRTGEVSRLGDVSDPNSFGSNGTTTITANHGDVTSNDVSVEVCNYAGPCIDIFSPDGSLTLFTSSPSKAFLDSIGGSSTSTGGASFEDGFSFNSSSGANDLPTAIPGDYYGFYPDEITSLCDIYNDSGLGERDNWRPATYEELQELYARFGNMFVAREWPTSRGYVTNGKEGIFLYDGRPAKMSPDINGYVSCVSEPYKDKISSREMVLSEPAAMPPVQG